MDYTTVNISYGTFDDVLNSLKMLEKIEFQIVSSQKECLIEYIEKNQPAMVCGDTFFLKFFPKRVGHDIHVFIIEKIDKARQKVLITCSKPFRGWIPLKELEIARNSNISATMIQNKWFKLINFNENIKETNLRKYIFEAIQINIKSMNNNDNKYYGIQGMTNFIEDLTYFFNNLEKNQIDQLLRNIFKSSKTIVEERKRYLCFLYEISKTKLYKTKDLINLYKKLTFSWDILRSLCLKKTLVNNISNEMIINKFNTLLQEEKKALKMLDNIFKLG
ncbi:MAG: DUF4872 domain-containing protein [Endomicrobia bacterium]|nr:DUF4872 domain-containing protein [Endomicrobiia bacterium]